MEDERLDQTELANKLLLDMIKNQKKNASNLFKAFIATICCYTAILISMVVGFFIYESQYEITDQVTDTVTEGIEQEVSGSDSSINNVEGDQYTGSAVHNEY